ncbi:MAG: hypothetical protein DELT_02614 [Desulfovibrio sp.]
MSKQPVQIPVLIVCKQCGSMFSCDSAPVANQTLPCGHAGNAVITTAPLDAFLSRDLLLWLFDNELVAVEAEFAIERAGGQYTTPHRPFKVPTRELTDDEKDRYGTQ